LQYILVPVTDHFNMGHSQDFLFVMARQPLMGQDLFIVEVSRSRSVNHAELGRTPLDE